MNFQKHVLNLTKQIPKGKISTYGEIARALGDISASRAVGNALNKNPNPIVVPCHRVVGAGFMLGGYSGLQVKREILTREKRGYTSSQGITLGDGKLQVFPVEFVLRKLGKA